MNDRIKEFKESARPEIDWAARYHVELNNGEKEKWMNEWFEKFAELIVRECAQLILDKKMGDLGDNPGVKAWEEGYNEAVHDCYYLIRKHFGVEE